MDKHRTDVRYLISLKNNSRIRKRIQARKDGYGVLFRYITGKQIWICNTNSYPWYQHIEQRHAALKTIYLVLERRAPKKHHT